MNIKCIRIYLEGVDFRGIGREQAPRMNKLNHYSMGLNIQEMRLRGIHMPIVRVVNPGIRSGPGEKRGAITLSIRFRGPRFHDPSPAPRAA